MQGPLSQNLQLAPITFRKANDFIKRHHRHHKPAQGHKFSISATKGGEIVGVVMVGRPVSRKRDDGFTAEVTRLCTDGTKNAPSFLLSAAARAAKAMGYTTVQTYTLPEEGGASLRAAGWTLAGESKGGSWDSPSRRRKVAGKYPTGSKWRWETR